MRRNPWVFICGAAKDYLARGFCKLQLICIQNNRIR